jgi:NTP pyrophosphatase (non-canonical NTP hydrolase)
MRLEDFVELSGRSENMDFDTMLNRLDHNESYCEPRGINMVRLLHGVLGVGSESGELLDAFKRYFAYGKDLDRDNVIEEVGDLLFYIALICRTMEVSLEEVCSINVAKLATRYPDKFTNEDALNRADKI